MSLCRASIRPRNTAMLREVCEQSLSADGGDRASCREDSLRRGSDSVKAIKRSNTANLVAVFKDAK